MRIQDGMAFLINPILRHLRNAHVTVAQHSREEVEVPLKMAWKCEGMTAGASGTVSSINNNKIS